MLEHVLNGGQACNDLARRLEITGHWFQKAEVQAGFLQGLKVRYGREYNTGVDLEVVQIWISIAALHCLYGRWLTASIACSWPSLGGKTEGWIRGQTLSRVALGLMGRGQLGIWL